MTRLQNFSNNSDPIQMMLQQNNTMQRIYGRQAEQQHISGMAFLKMQMDFNKNLMELMKKHKWWKAAIIIEKRFNEWGNEYIDTRSALKVCTSFVGGMNAYIVTGIT